VFDRRAIPAATPATIAIYGVPGRQGTVALPPHSERVEAALDEIDPGCRRAGLLR
jgi:hypothetical protein